jgi:hypothetical protein
VICSAERGENKSDDLPCKDIGSQASLEFILVSIAREPDIGEFDISVFSAPPQLVFFLYPRKGRGEVDITSISLNLNQLSK